MELKCNLNLKNKLMNIHNWFSSIFSCAFSKIGSKIKGKKQLNLSYNENFSENTSKNAENSLKLSETFKNNSQKSQHLREKSLTSEQIDQKQCENKQSIHSKESGFAVLTIVKIVIFVVIIVAAVITFFTMIYSSDLSLNISTIKASLRDVLMALFLTVGKWILCFTDIVFSYIKRLCGLEMDFSSLSGIFSADSDMIFNLMITAEDRASSIFRNLLVITIICIIIFTIIALIRSQFAAMEKGTPTSVMDTIKRTIKAFVLLLITPFISIGGIVFADLLLQTLYRATNTTNSMTLGTQVFAAASTTANAFRVYAQNDSRIPIVCDFSDDSQILAYYQDSDSYPSDTFREYLTSSNNLIYVTYMSFVNEDFNKFSDLNQILDSSKSEYKENAYYGIYDINASVSSDDSFSQYKRIEAYAEEYYVMADVIDFAVSTNNTLYMKTIEEVLDSIIKISDEETRNNLFSLTIQEYGIKFYMDANLTDEVVYEGTEFISAEQYSSRQYNIIYWTSYYVSPDDNGTPTYLMQIPYVHVKGATDELDGAKFIMAVEKTETTTGDFYYVPMTIGYMDRYDTSFNSDYIVNGQIISAKGIMKDGIYPTAIREVSNGGNSIKLCFYRDNVETAAVGAVNELFSLSMNASSNKFVLLLQAFFDPDSIVGDLSVDPNSVVTGYDAERVDYSTLVDGKIKISYFLTWSPTSTDFLAGSGTFTFKELFVSANFNLLLFAVAPLLLVKICLTVLFGLIQRSFELFLIILTYPVACATIPVDDRAYNAWWKDGYMKRLFSTYGFVLAINFVFMLFPIITQLTYFSAEDIATNKVVYKVVNLMTFGSLTITQMTSWLNTVTTILFELVAFTLLETAPAVISQILGSDNPKSDAFQNFMKAVNSVSKVIKTITNAIIAVVSTTATLGKMVGKSAISRFTKFNPAQSDKDINKIRNFKRKLIPGSALINGIKNDMSEAQKSRAVKNGMKDLKKEFKDVVPPGTAGEEPVEPQKADFLAKVDANDKSAVEAATKEYESAHKKWEAEHKAWNDKRNELHEQGSDAKKDEINKKMQALIDNQNDQIKQLSVTSKGDANSINEALNNRQDANLAKKYEEATKEENNEEPEGHKKEDGEDGGEDDGDDGSLGYEDTTKHRLRREKREIKKERRQNKKMIRDIKRLKNAGKISESSADRQIENLKSQNDQLKETIGEIKEAKKTIKQEKNDLKEQLKSGKISKEDYKKTKKENKARRHANSIAYKKENKINSKNLARKEKYNKPDMSKVSLRKLRKELTRIDKDSKKYDEKLSELDIKIKEAEDAKDFKKLASLNAEREMYERLKKGAKKEKEVYEGKEGKGGLINQAIEDKQTKQQEKMEKKMRVASNSGAITRRRMNKQLNKEFKKTNKSAESYAEKAKKAREEGNEELAKKYENKSKEMIRRRNQAETNMGIYSENRERVVEHQIKEKNKKAMDSDKDIAGIMDGKGKIRRFGTRLFHPIKSATYAKRNKVLSYGKTIQRKKEKEKVESRIADLEQQLAKLEKGPSGSVKEVKERNKRRTELNKLKQQLSHLNVGIERAEQFASENNRTFYKKQKKVRKQEKKQRAIDDRHTRGEVDGSIFAENKKKEEEAKKRKELGLDTGSDNSNGGNNNGSGTSAKK